jgi:hypothetical protein
MPQGVYDRSLYPRATEYRRNEDPRYQAWRLQRIRQNQRARAIRSEALARRAELLARLEQCDT